MVQVAHDRYIMCARKLDVYRLVMVLPVYKPMQVGQLSTHAMTALQQVSYPLSM